jgi:putative hydrolase
MLTVDFHTHSIFSACGIHTHIEILTRARELGMKAVAITDHGPTFEPRMPSPFFNRLWAPLEGIRLLKGMECNLLDRKGKIDVPSHFIKYLDVVLLGIHQNTKTGLGPNTNTNLLIRAMEMNPCIDIITHPEDSDYPVDFLRLAQAAKHFGVALELNNSKTMLDYADPIRTRALVAACKEVGCRMVVDSDMHALEELGHDDAVRHYLDEAKFPAALLVNATTQSALAFVEERRVNKGNSPHPGV